jgi:hypothetical protein
MNGCDLMGSDGRTKPLQRPCSPERLGVHPSPAFGLRGIVQQGLHAIHNRRHASKLFFLHAVIRTGRRERAAAGRRTSLPSTAPRSAIFASIVASFGPTRRVRGWRAGTRLSALLSAL